MSKQLPVPAGYLEKPTAPDPEFEWMAGAFWLLCPSRQAGFDIGYIPLTEIESYCRLFGVPDPAQLVAVIRKLDAIYVEHHREKEPNGRSDTNQAGRH